VVLNSLSNFQRAYVLPGLTLLGLLIVWQVVTLVFEVPKWLLPSPTVILEAMIKTAGALWTNSLVTLYESLAGFLLSVLIGVPLAILIVWSPYLRNTVYPILLLFQSIPKTAIAPLIVIWFGHGISSKVVVAFLVAFFPIVVDTAAGLMSVEVDMLNLSRSLKSSRAQEFRYIRLPNALPYFFSGCKVAITLAVIGAVIGEFVGGSQGLGYIILLAASQLQTSLVFAALVILSIQGIVLFYAIGFIERLVLPWYTPDTGEGALATGGG
jgi:NitT/TauT family transport system permease protein